jgi:hypothetical protein
MISCACAICGNEKLAYGDWFLVIENPWTDRLRINHWDHRLAQSPGILHACGAGHVRDLLMHWIVSGNLPTTGMSILGPHAKGEKGWCGSPAWDLAGSVQPIGELAVDRREICDSPQTLTSVVDAIFRIVNNEARRINGLHEQPRFVVRGPQDQISTAHAAPA